MFTKYDITYIRTGSGEKKQTDRITLYSTDTTLIIADNEKVTRQKKGGERVGNIIGAIEYFEEIAADWGTYENRNAITSIIVTEV